LPGKPRLLAMAGASNGAFLMFGGVAMEPDANGEPQRVYLRDAWSYRDGEAWQRLADLPKPLAAAASPAPLVDGRLLLVGGDDGTRRNFQPVAQHPGFPANVLAYDRQANRWTTMEGFPAPRATLPSVEWNGAFIFPSGEIRPGQRSPEVWRLTPAKR
jgi:N-acetylneuraminic acid mutarotase